MVPFISVVIPCYNREEYIENTILSILNQTVKPLEIILINDGSTDHTLSILMKIQNQYSELVRVIDLKSNKGPSYARNCGVKESNGNYILFMDSDDIAEPRLLEKYLYRLEELNKKENYKYILCYSGYIQIDESNKESSGVIRGVQYGQKELLGYEFVRSSIMSTSGVFINKEYFIKVKGFNEDIRYSEDWDLWLRLAAVGGFAYVDEPLVMIRRHEKNMSSNAKKMLEASKNVLKQYSTEYIKKSIFIRGVEVERNTIDLVSILFRLDKWEDGYFELKSLLDKGYTFYNIYFYLGLYYLKNGNYKSALDYFNKTINIKKDHGAALNNVGALFLLNGNIKRAQEHLELATRYFPSYMDAYNNSMLLNKDVISLEDLKFTWRELRKVLTNYSG